MVHDWVEKSVELNAGKFDCAPQRLLHLRNFSIVNCRATFLETNSIKMAYYLNITDRIKFHVKSYKIYLFVLFLDTPGLWPTEAYICNI